MAADKTMSVNRCAGCGQFMNPDWPVKLIYFKRGRGHKKSKLKVYHLDCEIAKKKCHSKIEKVHKR